MRRRTALILCTALAASAGTAAAGSRPSGSTTRFAPPVLVSSTQAARETSYAVDPTDTKRRFLCDPSGVPAVPDGQSYFHASRDGGKHWRYEKVETSPTDTRSAAYEGGDCDVAFDQGGTMYSADTWLGDLSIGHSTDHGETWAGTALSGTSPVVDRPWLVGGKRGELFVSYQDLQCCVPSAMWFMKSTDFGQTFTRAVPITTGDPGGLYTWEGNFVVSPGGRNLSLVYSRRSSGVVTAQAAPETIWVTQSHDGGATWTPKLIATLPVETTTIYCQIGQDAGGGLHVVWSAPVGKSNPISYTSSVDHGRSWSKAVSLNAGHTGWAPWVVGGKKLGSAAVVWLGSPEANALETKVNPWFFSWAKVSRQGATPTWTWGNTTKAPLFEGKQTQPEFEMVSLDAAGKLHLGMSIFRKVKNTTDWSVWSQDEL